MYGLGAFAALHVDRVAAHVVLIGQAVVPDGQVGGVEAVCFDFGLLTAVVPRVEGDAGVLVLVVLEVVCGT